jgi:hypothetical protein
VREQYRMGPKFTDECVLLSVRLLKYLTAKGGMNMNILAFYPTLKLCITGISRVLQHGAPRLKIPHKPRRPNKHDPALFQTFFRAHPTIS